MVKKNIKIDRKKTIRFISIVGSLILVYILYANFFSPYAKCVKHGRERTNFKDFVIKNVCKAKTSKNKSSEQSSSYNQKIYDNLMNKKINKLSDIFGD